MSSRTTYNQLNAEEMAEQAADAVRGLNHLTLDAGSLRKPSEVYRVLGSLEAMVARLPQAFAQLDGLLAQWVEDDLVNIDDGEFAGDPAAAGATASVYLTEEAPPAITRLQEAIDRAREAISFASFAGDLVEDEEGGS